MLHVALNKTIHSSLFLNIAYDLTCNELVEGLSIDCGDVGLNSCCGSAEHVDIKRNVACFSCFRTEKRTGKEHRLFCPVQKVRIQVRYGCLPPHLFFKYDMFW